jgi:hypothetical protein
MLTYLNIFNVASYSSKMPTKWRREFGKTFEMIGGFCFVIFIRENKRYNAGEDTGDINCMFF